MTLKEKVIDCADKFSKNKATNKAYHKIFEFIYLKNVIQKDVNDFGYSEIHSLEFKKITRSKYKDILQDLFENNLIYTNIPLSKVHLGKNFDKGLQIIRGYKIDRDLDINGYNLDFFDSIQKDEPQSFHQNKNNSSKIKSSLIHSLIIPFQFHSFFNSFPIFNSNGGAHFLKDGKYDIERIYNYIDIDRKNIPYQEGSEEWNELAKKWNTHTEAKKTGHRLYSWFHSIHGGHNGNEDERTFFTLNNSNLREAFDVPACNFCILAKLLEEKDIDQNELRAFQNMIRHDYIYGRIAKFIGIELNDFNKKQIKQACQHWLNIRKRYKHNRKQDRCLLQSYRSIFQV